MHEFLETRMLQRFLPKLKLFFRFVFSRDISSEFCLTNWRWVMWYHGAVEVKWENESFKTDLPSIEDDEFAIYDKLL